MRIFADEYEFTTCVIAFASECGWLVHHDRPARTIKGWRTPVQGHAGFPDLLLAKTGVVIFRELKMPRGRLSTRQRAWGHEIKPTWDAIPEPLNQVTRRWALFDVWRPEDFDTLIVPTLTGGDRS